MTPLPRCTRGIAGGRRCGAVLVERTDRLGRLQFDCPTCQRVARGLCLACPRPVYGTVGKARRCPEHHAAHLKAEAFRYWLNHKAERSAYQKRQRRAMRAGRPALTRSEIGRLGGPARAAALTPERRREIARLAGIASGKAKRAAMQRAA